MNSLPPIYIIFLFISPFLGTLLTSLFYAAIRKEVPPILPQVIGFSIGQSAIAIVAGYLVSKGQSALVGVGSFVLFIFLIVILFFQTRNDLDQERGTKNHISKILKSKVTVKAPFTLDLLEQIAFCLIPVDFYPDSVANQWSGYPRRLRREQFVDLITEKMKLDTTGLAPDDFLLPEDDSKAIRRDYVLIAVAAIICYLASIYLFINA